jgi:hypothetical protein
VLVENLMTLASTGSMPQARAMASYKLKTMMTELALRSSQREGGRGSLVDTPDADAQVANARYLADEIKRFLDRPAQPAQRLGAPEAPPGAPIGQPAMEWLRRTFGECSAGY